MNRDLRIVFMGTPDFAVETLKALIDNKYNVVGVVTSPDRPAGRGQKIQQSAVKKYAEEQGLTILQPLKFKTGNFVEELKALNANLQIVVAFRMLPEIVWDMPKYGTFNLHASLLPQYRGAAPINWAVINGEKETGITTFFIEKEIDTGNVLFQEKIKITKTETAGSLHDKLMENGAKLVIKTVKAIEENNYTNTPQNKLYSKESELKHAPKIFKPDCKINWDNDINNIYNKIRGLSPYPCSWTELTNKDGKKFSMKIYTSDIVDTDKKSLELKTDDKTFLHIETSTGTISLTDIQLAGKKRMKIEDFLRGNNLSDFKLAID
jgi:methionyl-tRNA formyltransferase